MNDFLLLVLTIGMVVTAKWTIGLGIHQCRQLLWASAGLFAGPLVMMLFFASDSVMNIVLHGSPAIGSISRIQRVCDIAWNLYWLSLCLHDAFYSV